MADIPIGLQLYSIRDDCKADLPGTLKAVADMGYDGVEFFTYYEFTADEIRKMLDDVGLRCCGVHAKFAGLLDDELARTVEFNQAVGNRFLICPSLPEDRRNSADAWRGTGELFGRIAAEIKPAGLHVGYHNHAVEFAPMDGKPGLDIFLESAGDDVLMQLDLGNALHGGADPIDYLKRYPGRSLTVHLKEESATNEQPLIGEGDIDWPAVFEVCESSGGTQWYIVEQEVYPVSPMESVARCLKTLRDWGK
jgi:sugar phosphate isomerase/epimerase